MLPRQTGIVFNTKDLQNVVSEIQELSRDYNLMKVMRRNARAYVENRSFESACLDNWKYYMDSNQ